MNIIDSDSARVFHPEIAKDAATAQTTPALRARLAKILAASGIGAADAASEDGPSHFTFGVAELDQALRGNAAQEGLPRAALHEIHSAEKGDRTNAAAMALLLAERCRSLHGETMTESMESRSILWVSETGEARRQGKLYPPGLAELGLDPASIIHVDAPDTIAVLRAAADGVRSPAMGAVIVELAGKKPKGLDMTATRRLSLSAQQTGVLTLLLRSGTDQKDPAPTAAFSRWEVGAAPSLPLEANASGHPAFDITLLRHRSGLYGLSARLEWNRDDRIFRKQETVTAAHFETTDTGIVPSVSADRTGDSVTQAA